MKGKYVIEVDEKGALSRMEVEGTVDEVLRTITGAQMSVLTTLLNTIQKVKGEELSKGEATMLFSHFCGGVAAQLIRDRAEIPSWELAHDKRFMADLLREANGEKPE